ncbi:MAG TPA: aldo/keto reductase [Solirubrobacteraceae bacterium]|jgi:aryl-alcohol dehydrogenase-like predicted oxidoreductase
MRHRTLGRTGLRVSELGYGAWGIGGGGWIGADDETSLQALREAIASGVNFIDTALVYGDGHSEELVGEVVRSVSEDILVATKVPPADRVWDIKDPAPADQRFPASWVIESTETSLRNLGLDTIDLQQFHTWTDAWVDEGEWAGAIETLKAAGKIRFFGVSIRPYEPRSALALIESGLVDAIQLIYNVFDQGVADELLPAALEHDVGIIVRVPFDEGGLTGRLRPDTTFPPDDFRNDYFAGDLLRETCERADAIMADLEIEEDKLANVALRFCLAQPAVSTVIAGMRSLTNVHRNVAAVDEGPLDQTAVEALLAHRWDRTA